MTPNRPHASYLRATIFALAALAIACARPEPPPAAAFPAPNLAGQPHDEFFAVGSLAVWGDSSADVFVRGWYGQHLRAMGEPRLGQFVDSAEVEAVRFLWLRTWGDPIAVRLMRRGENHALAYTQLDGDGGYDPGAVLRRDSVTLEPADWRAVLARLEAPEFWQPDVDLVGVDGAQWVVEAVVGGRYHLVDRWSPEQSGRGSHVRAFGLELLRLAAPPSLGGELY